MADIRIRNLTGTNTNPQSGQYLAIDSSSATQKIDYSTLKSAITSEIGTVVEKQATSAVSMPNETGTIVVSVNLDAGTWIVIGTLQFGSTGTTNCYKSASITTGTTTSTNINGKFQVQASGITCLSPTRVLTLTETTQVNLVGVHYYGSNLSPSSGNNLPKITAIRIK